MDTFDQDRIEGPTRMTLLRRSIAVLAAVSALLGVGFIGKVALADSERGPVPTLNDHNSKTLADGVISVDEYGAAIDAAVGCAVDKGATIVEAPAVGLDGVTLEYVLGLGNANEQAAIADAVDQCYREFAFAVDLLYQTASAVERVSTANIAALELCLGEHLEHVLADHADWVHEVGECAAKTERTDRPEARIDLKELSGS